MGQAQFQRDAWSGVEHLAVGVSVCIGYRHAVRSLAAKAGIPSPVDYPFAEKLENLLRCLKDRGLVYTIGRILAGGRRRT